MWSRATSHQALQTRAQAKLEPPLLKVKMWLRISRRRRAGGVRVLVVVLDVVESAPGTLAAAREEWESLLSMVSLLW